MAALAKRDMQERTVEVDREKLVKQLEDNLAKHKAAYKTALAGYKALALQKLNEGFEQAKVKLDKNLQIATLAINQFDPASPTCHVSDYITLVQAVTIDLKVPRDYSKAYETAIDMAKWDVRETLELTHAEFQCFVRDVWDWKEEFDAINATYSQSR